MRLSKLIRTNITIAAILLMGFTSIASLYFKEYRDDSLRRMRHESETEVSAMSSLFIQQVSVSRSMANDGFLISYLTNEESYRSDKFESVIRDFLMGCMRTYGFDAAFLSLTRNNALYSQNGFDRILSNDAASAWYNAALSHDRDYDINIDTDKFANNETSVFVNCKLRDRAGNLLGIIGVCIHVDTLIAAIKDFELSTGSRVWILGSDGNIEISTDRQGGERVDWFSQPGNRKFQERFAAVAAAAEHSEMIDLAEINPESHSYISVKYLPELSWFLVIDFIIDDLYASLTSSAVKTTLVFGIVLLVTMVVIGGVIHGFEKEIHGMSEERVRNLAAMRDAMMFTLADLVESRDQNTGEHIRKTASYVRIILEELKKEGEFVDTINDAYIENVVRSAPLHDIGKIKVPDAILNKPGKLTADEFTVMKRHAAAGGEVISHILDIVPDSEYLGEAKAIAAHHHEKWDGEGYPDGLSGDDIPLSARVMAVADVFDALVSERPYKKGFSVEKAFSIIREESGTHFDPKIVNAFLAAKDAVIAVERKFRECGMSSVLESVHA